MQGEQKPREDSAPFGIANRRGKAIKAEENTYENTGSKAFDEADVSDAGGRRLSKCGAAGRTVAQGKCRADGGRHTLV